MIVTDCPSCRGTGEKVCPILFREQFCNCPAGQKAKDHLLDFLLGDPELPDQRPEDQAVS